MLQRAFVDGELLRGGFQPALQLAAPGQQRAGSELRLLRRALQAAQLFAGVRQPPLSRDHGVFQLRVALLLGGELQVEFLETRLAGHAALFEFLGLGVDLGEFGVQLVAAARDLLGLLGQAQHLDLQLMRPRLAIGAVAAGAGKPLRRVGVSRLGADQRAAGLIRHQRLRADLGFEVLDLLRARQQPGLLRIRRVEAHRVGAHRMAGRRQDQLAMGQPAAQRQRFLDGGRRVDAFEPVVEQCHQPRIAHAQQVGQPRQRAMRVGNRAGRRGVEGELGRRRIQIEAAHRLDPPDFERLQPLAQSRFERGFPPGFDVDAPPQPLQPVQPMPRQPGPQLAFGLHLFLQRPQRVEPRRQRRLASRFAVRRALLAAALLVERRHQLGQLVQARIGEFLHLLRSDKLRAQIFEAVVVGRAELAALGGQALAAALQLAPAFVQVARLRGEQLDLLLHLAGAGALRGGALAGLAQRVLDGGQGHRTLFHLCGQDLALLFRLGELLGQRLQLGLGVFAAQRPLLRLCGDLGLSLQAALAGIDDVADALLQPADLHRRLRQRALRGVQRVAGVVVRLAQRVLLGFRLAQLGDAQLQRVRRRQLGQPDPLALAGGVAVFQEPELVQLQRARVLQRAVAQRDLGLGFELVEIGRQLAQDVVHAGQVLARVLQAVLGLAAAFLVLGHASRFFQEQPQLFGTRLDDLADRALADDGVGARAQAGAEEHVLHVATAHRLVVDVVGAGAVAGQHTLDRDLGVLVPRAPRPPRVVAEGEFDAGAAGGLAVAGAVEDHVLHRLAAQLAGLRLAQHPAHGVHDVGLAAAIGTDDADELAGQLEMCRIGEGFEARELDRIQAHLGEILSNSLIYKH